MVSLISLAALTFRCDPFRPITKSLSPHRNDSGFNIVTNKQPCKNIPTIQQIVPLVNDGYNLKIYYYYLRTLEFFAAHNNTRRIEQS